MDDAIKVDIKEENGKLAKVTLINGCLAVAC